MSVQWHTAGTLVCSSLMNRDRVAVWVAQDEEASKWSIGGRRDDHRAVTDKVSVEACLVLG